MSTKGSAPSETAALIGPTLVSNGLPRSGAPHDGGCPIGHRAGGRGQLSEIQRARMLSAMVHDVAEHGAGNVTVAHVVARSGVSRRTFYEIFDDREDCFLAAFDDAIERAASEVVPAFEGAGRWCERVRGGLLALLSFLEREPAIARLLLVESLAAGPRALAARARVHARLVAAVDEGRGHAKGGVGVTSLTAEGLVGAVLSILHGRVLGDRGGLVELTSPLMTMIVLPYLGPAAARRERERPLPVVGEGRARSASDPLREVRMRLTYRTVRTLIAVAANAGSSNRMIADAAGITDQGQISKLLQRLQGLGLIENTGSRVTRGDPNAWRLTSKGEEVHSAVAGQTAVVR